MTSWPDLPRSYSAGPDEVGDQFRVLDTVHGPTLSGELDHVSAPLLASALRRWEKRGRPFQIDLARVTFADSWGLEPLADSVQRCRSARRPGPRIAATSHAVDRVLGLLDAATVPFDLPASDAEPPKPHQQRNAARGHDWSRRRGAGPVSPTASTPTTTADRVTTLITTIESNNKTATMRINGKLTEGAVTVLTELMSAHALRGRLNLAVDIASATDIEPAALLKLTFAARECLAKVAVIALAEQTSILFDK